MLFSGENDFLLIDEPTNHLDRESREIVKTYLSGKKGFILVSHDRDFLDACVDHVLVLNRHSIEVQSGNFSSWWENKSRKDAFARAENEKHRKEIGKMKAAAGRARQWAEKSESSKIGFDPQKEPDRGKGIRPYIGSKTKKMQSRVRQIENRIEYEIEEKEGLLQDTEDPAELKIMPLEHYKKVLLTLQDFGLGYKDAEEPLFEHLSFEIAQGERVFLNGINGCGKSSLIKAVLNRVWRQSASGSVHIDTESGAGYNLNETGILQTASGLIISYISQDTSFLRGSIQDFCIDRGLEKSLFCAVLRQLDFERVQIEKLLISNRLTMLVVEHDVRFREQIATKVIEL